MSKEIVKKCIAWNAARYEQVFNQELALKLLFEETSELYEAYHIRDRVESCVEVMDAVGDITFVTIGILWKLGLSEEIIEDIFFGEDITTKDIKERHELVCYLCDGLNNLIGMQHTNIAYIALIQTFVNAVEALNGMGMQAEFYEIADAICISNATKEVKGKVDASVKANTTKGESYKSPTDDLHAIFANYRKS